ncbi:hypothetical protein MVEN_01185900 [Mycena venus]|uniref:ARM repeat-containing protein n=1 Tax=Mycena venus TaxID=2733690 RepID=A0A8H7CVU9_9AGAR|nr:hypothetical protein MVEN_01185900 [Mycena venus]
MPPLRRFPTPESVHSWWSDSNPPGPTISIHTFAKPLSKFLHNRQALRLITGYRRSPNGLSQEALDVIASYLGYQGISRSTKVAILNHLHLQTLSEEEAKKIINGDSATLRVLITLLADNHPDIIEGARLVLENIGRWKSALVIDQYSFSLLTTLLWHSEVSVKSTALHLLYCMSLSRLGAYILHNSEALRVLITLMADHHPDVKTGACLVLENITRWQSALVIDKDSVSCLVYMLEHPDVSVTMLALHVLNCATLLHAGADILSDSDMARVRESVACSLCRISQLDDIPANCIETLVASIVLVEGHDGCPFQEQILVPLARITSAESLRIEAVMKLDVHKRLLPLLYSADGDVDSLRWTCFIIGNIARQTLDVVGSTWFSGLLALLRHSRLSVRMYAVYALIEIIQSRNECDAMVLKCSIEAAVPNFRSLEPQAGGVTFCDSDTMPWSGQTEFLIKLAVYPLLDVVGDRGAKTLSLISDLAPSIPLLSLLSSNEDVRSQAKQTLFQMCIHVDNLLVVPPRGPDLTLQDILAYQLATKSKITEDFSIRKTNWATLDAEFEDTFHPQRNLHLSANSSVVVPKIAITNPTGDKEFVLDLPLLCPANLNTVEEIAHFNTAISKANRRTPSVGFGVVPTIIITDLTEDTEEDIGVSFGVVPTIVITDLTENTEEDIGDFNTAIAKANHQRVDHNTVPTLAVTPP